MPMLRTITVTLLVSLCTTGCVRRAPPAEALIRASEAVASGSTQARTLALAGFHSWLVSGKAAEAQERFDRAIASDPANPYALFGQHLMARRRAHPERALVIALDLCERAPRHPLAAPAARYVLELSGTAISLDDLILSRGPGLLERGLQGDAAQLLRSALATIHYQRGHHEPHRQLLAQMGIPTSVTVLGPLSAHSVLSFDEPTLPEKTGEVPDRLAAPQGSVQARVLAFPEGRFSLNGEPNVGDVYVVAVDVEVNESATYVVRTVTSAAHKVYLDGTLVASRRSFERSQSTVDAQGVALSAGRHRLVLRLSKDDRTGSFSLGLFRADGRAAQLSFSPAQGPAPSWRGVDLRAVSSVYPDTEDLYAALEPEVGGLLASYLAVKDGLSRDRDGAKKLLADLVESFPGPALTSLRAEVSLSDRTIPNKVAHGRAARDLEAALEKDPSDVHALLLSASLALDEGRHLDASEVLRKARAAHQPVGYPVWLTQARVELGLNVEALAEQSAVEAIAAQPGLCEGLALRYNLARRREAVAAADRLVSDQEHCPGSLLRQAEHARARGKLEEAAQRYRLLVERDPAQLTLAHSLVNLYVALRRFDDAVALLRSLRELWPRHAALLKKQAEVHDFAGQPELALKAREQALALDGSDLTLRRMVARAKEGTELLQKYAIDGQEAIAAYEASRVSEEATSAYVLDAATVQVFADGSMVDRVHLIQKALDQSGVSNVAEVNLPAGAQVLRLRTLKADGSVLEPERIAEKDSISLPGVQVGDYVEVEYLLAHAPRGPIQPGFTAASFYFQIFGQPNHWPTYTVLAPLGTGMTVDAHHMLAPKVVQLDGQELLRHQLRGVPPFLPEPNSPPSTNEYLPFITVGAGQRGNEGLVAAYADAFLDRAQRTHEVEAFARQATQGKTGKEAVAALYSAVMSKIQGRDAGLSTSAAASLAQERGSRLLLLKASLESLGFPARLVAVRTFNVDPSTYMFPNEALLPYLCLRVALPSGEQLWLDPLVRFAPFGELPEQALGGREAYLLPEPGRPLQRLTTPHAAPPAGKQVRLELTLDEEGTLRGSGEENYSGFDAARLGEALEALSEDQRGQALQSALSRYFRGAELSELSLQLPKAVGEALTVRYTFNVPQFARSEGNGQYVLGALTFPSYLGRRYLQLSARRTPLFIDATERSRTTVSLTLPPGYRVQQLEPELKTVGTFGAYIRTERLKGSTLRVEEDFRLDMARIPPEQYSAFAQFAGEVDLLQSRDVVIGK